MLEIAQKNANSQIASEAKRKWEWAKKVKELTENRIVFEVVSSIVFFLPLAY